MFAAIKSGFKQKEEIPKTLHASVLHVSVSPLWQIDNTEQQEESTNTKR